MLAVKVVEEMRERGADPDIWKIEGLDTAEDCEKVAAAIKAGALGGKILGAGGGGFVLFYVKPEHQSKVKKVLNKLTYVPFNFENSGSKVVLFQPAGL